MRAVYSVEACPSCEADRDAPCDRCDGQRIIAVQEMPERTEPDEDSLRREIIRNRIDELRRKFGGW